MPKKHLSQSKEGTESFMYPELHQPVANTLFNEIDSPSFHKKHSGKDSNKEYSTHVMGTFECPNHACHARGWGSKKVAILIRRYPRNEYNALVFNQRCKSCDSLGDFTLNKSSYIERVSYRLNKWAGAQVEPPFYGSKKGLPHEGGLCEGCKRGICQSNERTAG